MQLAENLQGQEFRRRMASVQKDGIEEMYKSDLLIGAAFVLGVCIGAGLVSAIMILMF